MSPVSLLPHLGAIECIDHLPRATAPNQPDKLKPGKMGAEMLNRIAILLAITVVWPLSLSIATAADFNAQAATEAYLATVGGAARAKSDAYF